MPPSSELDVRPNVGVVEEQDVTDSFESLTPEELKLDACRPDV
jgi:hypothetical protein